MNTRVCSTCKIEKPLTDEYWHKDSRKKYGYMYICKECRGNKRRKNPKIKAKKGFKICSKCGKELPATFEYYHKDSATKDGFYSSCKTCNNKTPTSQKEGYKVCIRCLRELPMTRQYFSKNCSSSDSFLGYCKECQGRTFNLKQVFLTTSDKEGYKICSKCGNELILNEDNFNKSKVSKDGFANICKKCRKGYLEKNKETIREKFRLYRQENKEAFNVRKQVRRTLKENLISDFTIEDWNNCLKYFDYSCSYCGIKSDDLQQEHFIPVVKSGNYTKDNIIPACHSCNSSKKDRNFFKWYPKQEFYSKEREQKILDYLKKQ